MSFNDLERGESSQPLLRGNVPDEDKAFTSIKDSVSIQIFKIQSNVQGIQRLVDKLGGQGDGPPLRNSLHNLTEVTRDMIKKSTEDVKKLAAVPTGGPHPSSRLSTYSALDIRSAPHATRNLVTWVKCLQASRKPIQSKLNRDFTTALGAFQRVQRLSAEKQRSYVESQKRRVDALVEDDGLDEPRGSVELEQVQAQQTQQVSTQELEFQETLIAERETEIREIETGIHELNDIFRDLGSIVEQQGGLVDNIESNITSVAQNTSSAAEELTTAHEYQRKAGRRMACLLVILIIVVAVILLAILS